jgi:transcriptional regulator with XRE-family HTH domain
MPEIINSLVSRRRALKLSQIAIAQATGTSRYTIMRFENGQHEASLAFIERYAKAVNAALVVAIRYA